MSNPRRYTLTISCPDRAGIIAAVSGFIAEHGGFIVEASYHTEVDANLFFMRQEILADSLPFDATEFSRRFVPLANDYKMTWQLSDSSEKKTAGNSGEQTRSLPERFALSLAQW